METSSLTTKGVSTITKTCSVPPVSANKLVRPRSWKSAMTLTLIAGAFIAVLYLACQTPSPPAPSPTTTAAALPAPPPASIPGTPTPVTHQLMVVADPDASARFLLNSVPLDRAHYYSAVYNLLSASCRITIM